MASSDEFFSSHPSISFYFGKSVGGLSEILIDLENILNANPPRRHVVRKFQAPGVRGAGVFSRTFPQTKVDRRVEPTIRSTNMSNWVRAVMGPKLNPLAKLQPAHRFQVMIALSVMWSLIFCGMAGITVWYPAYVAAHVALLVIGTVVTTIVFRSASRR